MKLPGHGIAELAQRAVGSGFRGKGIRRRINDALWRAEFGNKADKHEVMVLRRAAHKERSENCNERSKGNTKRNVWPCVDRERSMRSVDLFRCLFQELVKLAGYDQVRICHSVLVFWAFECLDRYLYCQKSSKGQIFHGF